MKAERQSTQIRLTIRVGADEMTISTEAPRAVRKITTESYPMDKSISVAANMREAFNTSELLQSGYQRVLLQHTTPIMLMPLDEFITLNGDTPDGELSNDIVTLFQQTLTLHTGYQLMSSVLPQLHAVAVYSVNKDLCTVVNDHFSEVRHQTEMEHIWAEYYDKAFSGNRKKLFAYFHDHKMDVFAFTLNRFRYSNAFNADNTHDAVYFILSVWNQLGLSGADDELHLIGKSSDNEQLKELLQQYVARIYE